MSGARQDSNSPLPPRSSALVFSLLFLLYLFDYLDRYVVVSLFPYLQRDWGLTDTQCGMLTSAVYWSIVVFSLPASVFVDRWSRKKSIGCMAILWSLATGACAFTRSFSQLFAARALVGIGEAGYAPGGTAMISALFPERRRSLFVGIWNMSIPLGSALGIAIGGYVAMHFGWRHAFGLVALPGMASAILFFFVRDYRTVELGRPAVGGAGPAGGPERMAWGDIVREFTSKPSLLLTYLGFAGNMLLSTAMMSWLPTFFHRVEGLPMDRASLRTSIVMLLAIVGAPLGGFLADSWRKRRRNARLLFPALSSTVTAGIFFAALSFLNGPARYGALLLGGITATAFASAAIAVTQDVVHPGLRATSYSFCVIVQNLLGSSLGPLVAGALSDRNGVEAALTTVSVFPLLSGVLFFAGSFFYERDLAKVGEGSAPEEA